MSLSFPLIPGYSAAESLALSTDGPLDPALEMAARAHDAANPLPAPARVRLGNVRIDDAKALRLVSDCMVRALTLTGAVTEADLARTGLEPAQLARLAPRAARLLGGLAA